MTQWQRIEGSGRSAAMTGGVEARIADPLWMLAKQWQVGEFIGDDAGSPLAMHVHYESTTIDSFSLGTGAGSTAYDPSSPLEYTVEAAPRPVGGGARVSAALDAAHGLIRVLRAADAAQLIESLTASFPIDATPEVTLGSRGDAIASMIRRRSFDGLAVAALNDSALRDLFDDLGLPEEVWTAMTTWRRSIRSRYSSDDSAWKSERLEHAFQVSAPTANAEPIVLRADSYPGGHLAWHSFDVISGSDQELAAQPTTFTTMPTPVHYEGMPAARWWEFEDRNVQFGDIDAGPTDLARMIVADFATVYSDDWFVVPLALANGSITRVRSIDVVDTFGEPTVAASTAATDNRAVLGRSWAMFEMHGDLSVDKNLTPLLFLPPVLATSLHGPPIERVEFARDEGANLGWAVERTVEGVLGRPVDRRESWLAAQPPTPPVSDRTEPVRYEDLSWSYRLESAAPPFWIPLVPERIDDERSDIHFRRARMQTWQELDPAHTGPKGELLEPHRPLTIREEEIPRGGLNVERSWQYARWVDGSTHLWVQRRRRPGRGERSSGLQWDLLDIVRER